MKNAFDPWLCSAVIYGWMWLAAQATLACLWLAHVAAAFAIKLLSCE